MNSQYLNTKSPAIFKKGRFYNFKEEKKRSILFLSLMHSIFIPSMIMLLISLIKRKFYHNQFQIDSWKLFSPVRQKSNDLEITWVGHATLLIQIGNINIITDPVFGDLNFLFRRILPSGVKLHDLPKIDFVLISHNHRDHLDLPSIKKLLKQNNDITFLVPLGLKTWFEKHNIYKVKEYNWWQQESFNLESNITFNFLPAFHSSFRHVFDYNRSLWGSWMIECNGKKIYFAGDTGYAGHFKVIGQVFKDIDVACLPIGPGEPHKWVKASHVNAQEAGQAFIDLQAKHFIPIHWGTFYFGTDRFQDPINMLTSWFNHQNLYKSNIQLHILKIGQRVWFNNS